MRRLMTVAVILTAVLLTTTSAFAGGGQQYPNGAEDIYCGACPPPGWWGISYTYYKDIDKFTDAGAGGADVSLDGEVFAEVVRIINSRENTILGGRHLMHAFFIYMDVDLGMSGDDSGLSNIIFDPIILTWSVGEDKNIHLTTGVDIYIPVGDHDDAKLVNVGKDFWTFEPIFAVTGIYDQWSFSAKFMYDFNTTTDVQVVPTGVVGNLTPGQEFHFDYAADYAIGNGVRAGLNGYYYKQIEDDEIDGVDSTGGFNG